MSKTTIAQYSKDEMMSATHVAKKFGSVLDTMTVGKLDKIAVLKNNQLKAIILSVEDYEYMHAIVEYVEDLELSDIVRSRLDTDIDDYIPYEAVLKDIEQDE